MSIRLQGDAAAEFRAHWPVVLASTAGFVMSNINIYTIGLFIEPFQHAFGWTRSQITIGPLITAIVTMLAAPFAGAAIDRFGPRRIGICGVVGIASLTALLSQVGPSIWSWWGCWTLLALINPCLQPSVWTAGVGGFFAAGRGLAFAMTLCGSGINSLISPFLTYELIAHFGWRLAFVGIACWWSIIVIPLVLLFFDSRRDQALAQMKGVPQPRLRNRTGGARKILSGKFLQLMAGTLLIAAVAVSYAVSLVPVLSWNGLSRTEAASAAGLLGIAAIIGRLMVGFLLDRFDGRLLAAFCVCLPIATSMILIGCPHSLTAAVIAICFAGLALGTELDLVAYLTSRHFGLAHFGLLFGTIGGFVTLVGALGPWAMSRVYDAYHSYLPALWAVIPMCLLSALLFLLLGPYPDPATLDDLVLTANVIPPSTVEPA